MERHQRIAIWVALAEHFLDTETRHQVPFSAMRCVDAGLSVDEGRDIWCYEVTPAVWHNLRDVAGEWAGWPEDWLVREIERSRDDGSNRPGPGGETVYRMRIGDTHRTWVAIERCMVLLERAEPAQRSVLARDLQWLAERFFDMRGTPLGSQDPAALRALYAESFLPIFEPLVVLGARESVEACRERVERALSLA